LLEIFIQVALLFGGWKLYRWSKSKQRADTTKWRRRVAALLFVSPMMLWLLEAILPAGAQDLVDGLSWLNTNLDKLLKWVIGSAKEELDGQELGGAWLLAIKPIVYSLAYGGLGALIGWPLDRLRKKKAEAEDAAEEE
jgi:hypothetical protein